MCFVMFAGVAQASYVLPGNFAGVTDNADVVFGYYTGGTSAANQDVVVNYFFATDGVPQVVIPVSNDNWGSVSRVHVISCDANKLGNADAWKTALSGDFMLMRAQVTATNTAPGREQKIRFHMPVVGTAVDAIDYTLTLAGGAASDFDFGAKDVKTLNFVLDTSVLSKEVTIRWNACCPVTCSQVFKDVLRISWDGKSAGVGVADSADVASVDIYAAIVADEDLDCGTEKAWQLLPATYNTVSTPYMTFAHKDDLVIWGEKKGKNWGEWGTHELDLGPFVVEMDRPVAGVSKIHDWVAEAVWNKTAYLMSADTGVGSDGLYHSWFVAQEQSGYNLGKVLAAADVNWATFTVVPTPAAAQPYQHIGKVDWDTAWVKPVVSFYSSYDATGAAVATDFSTPLFSKDITPKHVAFFGYPLSGDTKSFKMNYKAYKSPAVKGTCMVDGWNNVSTWTEVTPVFCETTKIDPQVFYPSECLGGAAVKDPCSNKIFTFRARTIHANVKAKVATVVAVSSDLLFDVCEEGCKPTAKTECSVAITDPCSTAKIAKTGKLTVSFTSNDKLAPKTAIAPYRVGVVFNRNDNFFTVNSTIKTALDTAFGELPEVDSGPVDALLGQLTVASYTDASGTNKNDLAELALASGTKQGLRNYFRLFPETDKTMSVKAAWAADKSMELSFYVVFVDGIPADGKYVKAQNGYFVVYDGKHDYNFVNFFAMLTKCGTTPTPTTPVVEVKSGDITASLDVTVAPASVDVCSTTKLDDLFKGVTGYQTGSAKINAVKVSKSLDITPKSGDTTVQVTINGTITDDSGNNLYKALFLAWNGTSWCAGDTAAKALAIATADASVSGLVKEGGSFDLKPGAGITCKVILAEVLGQKTVTPTVTPTGGSSSSGGGCNVGLAPLALVLLAPLALFLKK